MSDGHVPGRVGSGEVMGAGEGEFGGPVDLDGDTVDTHGLG